MPDTDEKVELRGDVPGWAGAVFEGVKRARGLTKDELLTRIVIEWARKELHVATVVQRMTRGKACIDPPEGDRDGN